MDAKPSTPIASYKTPAQRLRVGYHVRLANGTVGRVTWISNGQVMIKAQ